MHRPQCQTFRPLMTLFSPSASDALSQQLSQGSGYGNSHECFPSVTLVLQHLVFKISFHQLFTAPSPLPGGDEKVILIFQRSPVNYSAGPCIAYSLQSSLQCTGFSLWWLPLLTEHRLSMHRLQ